MRGSARPTQAAVKPASVIHRRFFGMCPSHVEKREIAISCRYGLSQSRNHLCNRFSVNLDCLHQQRRWVGEDTAPSRDDRRCHGRVEQSASIRGSLRWWRKHRDGRFVIVKRDDLFRRPIGWDNRWCWHQRDRRFPSHGR